MSRKSLEYFLGLLLALCAQAQAQSPSCVAVYASSGISRKTAISVISDKFGFAVKEIKATSLKDHLSIRSEAAKLQCGGIFILQKSADVDSVLISSVLMSTQNGQTISENAFSDSSWKEEFSTWIATLTEYQKGIVQTFNDADLIYALSKAGRCDDLHRFLEEEKANALCNSPSAVFKRAPIKDPFKLVMSGVPYASKQIWIDSIESSTLFDEGRKILTKPAEIRISCEGECKEGQIYFTVFTTKEFLSNEDNPIQAMGKLISKLLECRQEVVKATKTKPFPLLVRLRSESGSEMEIKVSGSSQNPKLHPSESIKSFIQNR